MEIDYNNPLDVRKRDLLDAIEMFLQSIGKTRNDTLIVGSLSLYQYGFPVTDIHDVDLELEDTELIRQQLLPLSRANQDTDCTYKSNPNRMDFKFRGINFNVFLVKDLNNHKFMYMDYFKFKLPLDILSYKLKYRRKKDLEWFRLFIDKITKFLSD